MSIQAKACHTTLPWITEPAPATKSRMAAWKMSVPTSFAAVSG